MDILGYVNNLIRLVEDHVQVAVILGIIAVGGALLLVEQPILEMFSYTIWSVLLAVANIIAVYTPTYYIAREFGVDLDLQLR